MNSYQHQFIISKLNQQFFSSIEKTISRYSTYRDSTTEYFDGKEYSSNTNDSERKSKVCFLEDSLDIYDHIWEMVDGANSRCFWNFDLDLIEPLQNTLYEVGDYYGWHTDESNWTPSKRSCGRIRKVSFTLLLNDDFNGGDFEMITDRKTVVPLQKGDMIFFHSDIPHRVTEVTSGFRKSLVGWIQGPAFK